MMRSPQVAPHHGPLTKGEACSPQFVNMDALAPIARRAVDPDRPPRYPGSGCLGQQWRDPLILDPTIASPGDRSALSYRLFPCPLAAVAACLTRASHQTPTR